MPDEPDPSKPGYAAPTPPTEPTPATEPPPADEPAPHTEPTPTTPPASGAPPTEPVQAPPPGWGTPPPPGAGSTGPRRRRRWPWVLGAVLGTIVILAISSTVLFIQKVKPPIDAANDFLGAVESDDFGAAFDSLCAADQDAFSPDELEGLFGFGFLDDYSVNPFDVDVDGDKGKVSFDAEGTGDDDYFEIPVRKEDGDWRVCLTDDPDFSTLNGGGLEDTELP